MSRTKDLEVFASGLVESARGRMICEVASCLPINVVTTVHDKFECWSVGLGDYRHNGIEHWTLSCKLLTKSSTIQDWHLLGRLVEAFLNVTGYPDEAPDVEPVVPIEDAHPEATNYWHWHSDGTDVDPVVDDILRSIASDSMPQRPQAVAPQEPGRNDLCHCGSGRKYKKCHGAN